MKKPEPPKSILITGASGDIGAALAMHYARPGVSLCLIGQTSDKLALVGQHCLESGARVFCHSVDVRDEIAMRKVIAEFDDHATIDLLIANAGVTSNSGPQGELESWAATRRVLDVNLYGVFNTVYPALEVMRPRGKGQIAIVSSLAALRGLAITPAYCASKAGIKAWGDALRGLVGKDNIHVSVIMPGFVKSSMSDQFQGAKPFMLSADNAAAIVVKGLSKGKAHIAFPLILSIGTGLLSLLPTRLGDFILQQISYGNSRKR